MGKLALYRSLKLHVQGVLLVERNAYFVSEEKTVLYKGV